jgi:hypothetical protein
LITLNTTSIVPAFGTVRAALTNSLSAIAVLHPEVEVKVRVVVAPGAKSPIEALGGGAIPGMLSVAVEEGIVADPTFFTTILASKPSAPDFTIVGCPTTAITPCCGVPPSSTKYAIIAAPIASSTRVTSIASTGPLRSPLLAFKPSTLLHHFTCYGWV